jgi:diacylglycerol kinase (ATP)
LIDLPRIESGGAGNLRHTHFAQLAGAGLDSRAIQLVDWSLKKKFGPLAYVIAGLRAMTETLPTLTISDGANTASGQLVLIGNGRLYGGKFRVFPHADPADGLLDVCVFPRVSWANLVRCGARLLLAGTLPEQAVVRMQSRSFNFTSNSSMPFEVDGELASTLPARVTVRPAALRILVP